VVLFCLVGLLCARISFVLAQEEQAETCLEIFIDMIEVAKFREMLKIGAQQLQEKFRRGELSKESLDTTLEVWHYTDNKLENQLRQLTKLAQTQKCFEEQ